MFIVLVVKIKHLFCSFWMVQHPAVTFQIDTGSSANILPLQDYFRVRKDNSKANIVAKEILLIVHDHSKRKVLGSVMLKVEHKGNKHELNFDVVDQEVATLLDLK